MLTTDYSVQIINQKHQLTNYLAEKNITYYIVQYLKFMCFEILIFNFNLISGIK